MQRVSCWSQSFQNIISCYKSIQKLPSYHIIIRHNHNHTKSSRPTASDKLFADAAREEADDRSLVRKPSQLPLLENQHENWTGEESMQDAVLRMLVDKYKPLRTGSIQTAEQKLKATPPTVASSPSLTDRGTRFTVPSTGSWATEPLLPSSASHRPWHTQFKAPSHTTSSVKLANIPPIPNTRQPNVGLVDERGRRKGKEEKRKAQYIERLSRAKESTLDYRLGIKHSSRPMRRPMPVSLKGWSSLIEGKIEEARKAGLFATVKGRGQPIPRNIEESNPFISREEFLMNRIIQRNGAAPPWIVVQGELDTTVQNFRDILRQSWIRRAVRVLTTANPVALLHTISLKDIKALRDTEWEERERSYHETALDEINSLVRKYNGFAPYSARRPYYSRTIEVERLYDECAEDISRKLVERIHEVDPLMRHSQSRPKTTSSSWAPNDAAGEIENPKPLRIQDLVRGWLKRLISKLWLIYSRW